MQASCVLLPHPSEVPGQYILTQLFSDKVRARGNITAAEKTRADTLLGHLVEKTRKAMLKADWKEDGFTGLQGQPGTKVLYRKGE